jgi:integrase
MRLVAKGPNKWQLTVEPRRIDGVRQKRRTSTFIGTEAQAKRKLAQLQADIDRQVYVDPAGPRLSEYLPKWLEGIKGSVARRTFTGYEAIVNDYLIPAFGQKRLSQLSSTDLRTAYAKWGETLAPQSILHRHRVLYKALQDAIRHEPPLLVRNVAESVKPPRIPRKQLVTLTPEEIHRLLAEAKSSPWYSAILLAVYGGFRRSEIMALRWSDIKDHAITVNQSLEPNEKGKKPAYVVKAPKNETSRRTVIVDGVVIAALKERKAKQNADRLKAGPHYRDKDFIFANEIGDLYNPDSMFQAFKAILKRAGLPSIRFHDLRHTHATLLAEAGVSLNAIKDRLGHSTITMTANLYSHVTILQQADAAEKFAQRMSK